MVQATVHEGVRGDEMPVVAGDADIATLAGLLADPTRVAMLLALSDGRALPAGDLARCAGVAASTASGHLTRLVGSGLLAVEQWGRHRYYRLATPQIALAIPYPNPCPGHESADGYALLI
jgi:DNA-binding transcriptional ArsR family regulator